MFIALNCRRDPPSVGQLEERGLVHTVAEPARDRGLTFGIVANLRFPGGTQVGDRFFGRVCVLCFRTRRQHVAEQPAGAEVVGARLVDRRREGLELRLETRHRRAGLEMAQAIVSAGYRRIGFLGTKMPLDHRARKRFEGFTEMLAKNGLEIEDRDFYSGGSALAKGREMTQAMLERTPELDFLYYSNDLIGAGGLLYLLDQGIDVPGQIGLAGFNGVDLLQGLPRQLATMDACRVEIGRAAAQIVADRLEEPEAEAQSTITLTPKISFGDTLKRR